MKNHSFEPKSLRFLWGGIAFAVYFGIIGLLLIYFNHRNIEKPKHFVKKDEKRVQVVQAAPVSAIKVKTIINKPKPPVKPKKSTPKKTKVVKPIKPKAVPKKEKVILKEKIVKKKLVKKKDDNRTKPKKKKPLQVNKPKAKVKKEKKPKKIEKPKKSIIKKTSDLFSSVKTVKKETKIKEVEKSKSANKQTTDKKKLDSGIENAYFAKVQALLETWPAQSDYAGEKATVSLYVKPTGMFEFKVKSQSDNVDFNLGLIDFLMQLQRIGFGKHNAGKTYEFQVEFIAKE